MVNVRTAAVILLIISISLAGCSVSVEVTVQPDTAIAGSEETIESTAEVSEFEELVEPGGVFDPSVPDFFGEGVLPGSEPVPFGSGWFKGGFHSAPVFAPDGGRVWWGGSYGSEKVYTSRYADGVWTEQEEVSFSDNIRSYRDPFISPDGLKLYFISEAPLPGKSADGKENIWMMEWEEEGWSEPQPLPDVVNSYRLHWTVSVASNYDLYFAANVDGNPDIFKSDYINGEYTNPVSLGPPISTEQLEFTPNIAPDQSYLLFSRAMDNTRDPHLYISYADGKGWTEPVRVENVESCISPIVTPDRQYVIYLDGPSLLMWRDTSFIEELRSE